MDIHAISFIKHAIPTINVFCHNRQFPTMLQLQRFAFDLFSSTTPLILVAFWLYSELHLHANAGRYSKWTIQLPFSSAHAAF
ncbi:hypothetical protein A0H81_07258 [Grifola frondosa]|uniref:Uncharacterized protein n=1 Tax=Grifola frondosa TaxID=5627 RepID=A0A1C7MAP7_GRIFR|nr:hypothetical protein A0H81_07258 [Grifola frondosa]